MWLNVSSILRAAGSEITFDFSDPVELDFPDGGWILDQPVQVNGVVRNIGEDVLLLSGLINARLSLRCDRCLALAAEELKVPFAERYAKKADSGECYAFEGDIIDISEMVREIVLLGLPTKRLCRPDCRGLCQKCGADRNTTQCNCIIE